VATIVEAYLISRCRPSRHGSSVDDDAAIAVAVGVLATAQAPRVFDSGIAVDILFTSDDADDKAITARLRGALHDKPIDVVVQPAAGRRKGLFIVDMDSTVIGQECIDELADDVGSRICADGLRYVAAEQQRADRAHLDQRGGKEHRALLRGELADQAERRRREGIDRLADGEDQRDHARNVLLDELDLRDQRRERDRIADPDAEHHHPEQQERHVGAVRESAMNCVVFVPCPMIASTCAAIATARPAMLQRADSRYSMRTATLAHTGYHELGRALLQSAGLISANGRT